MKTIIAGSRGCTEEALLERALSECGWTPTMVISGTARGADQMGEKWASENGVPCQKFPADWKTFGKSAGIRRNEQMAEHAEALIAIWDGTSRGTAHMIREAQRKGLRTFVLNTKRHTLAGK